MLVNTIFRGILGQNRVNWGIMQALHLQGLRKMTLWFIFIEKNQMKTDNDKLAQAIAEKKAILKEKYGMLGEHSVNPLPPELHLQWLNDVIAFEEQWANASTITVNDRLGNPVLLPAHELTDAQLDVEWRRLQQLMKKNGLELCSIYTVPIRELYRFAVEELMSEEIDDIRLPNMTTHFIYEEFYPEEEEDSGSTPGNSAQSD